MPQLMWGAGDPTAISIEAGILCYFAAEPPAMLAAQPPMTRAMMLGGLYLAYNMFVVPSFSMSPGMTSE